MLGLKCAISGTGFDVTNRKRLYGIVENTTQKNQTVTFILKSVFEKKIKQKELKVTIIPPGGTLASSFVPGSLVKSSSGSTVYYVNDDSTISAFADLALLKVYGFEKKSVVTYDLSQAVVGDLIVFPDGAVVKIADGQFENNAQSAVFVIQGTVLRPIASAQVYQALYDDPHWNKVHVVPVVVIKKLQYSLGSALASAEDRVIGSTDIKRLKK